MVAGAGGAGPGRTCWFTPIVQSTPSASRWDETPGRKGGETPGVTPSSRVWDATPGGVTPGALTPGKRNRWDETPKAERGETPSHFGGGWAETPRTDRAEAAEGVGATPTPGGGKRRSRWDETPSSQRLGGTPSMTPSMTPMGGATPNLTGATPAGAMAMQMQTPSPGVCGEVIWCWPHPVCVHGPLPLNGRACGWQPMSVLTRLPLHPGILECPQGWAVVAVTSSFHCSSCERADAAGGLTHMPTLIVPAYCLACVCVLTQWRARCV